MLSSAVKVFIIYCFFLYKTIWNFVTSIGFFSPDGQVDIRKNRMNIDSNEDVWNYWREDTLMHVFHVLVHNLHNAYKGKPRNDERFWYMHQQLTRRFAILFF